MKLRASEAQEFRLSVAGAREPIVPFNLRKYEDHIKKVLLYLFKRYEGDVTTNGHLLLNTDSILILNHEALPAMERKESKLL